MAGAESTLDEEDAQLSDPAQAFNDLRTEVAQLRRELKALPGALKQNRPRPPPDYSEDLGCIAKELTAVAGRLDKMEKHPALRLTPDQHRQAVADAGDVLMRNSAGKLDQAAKEAGIERDRLAGLIGAARAKGEQRSWLLWTGFATLIAGLLLAPLLASVLPFGLNSRVAALVMKANRWNAGMVLMKAEDPEGWRDMADAAELVRVNQEALKTCRQAAAKAKKDQRCAIVAPAR